jgi:hypothetical protein
MQRLAPCRKAVRALAARYPRSHRPKRISTDALWARRHVGCSSRDGHTMRPRLRQAGLVECHHKQLVIHDPKRLEEAACECYHIVRGHFARWLP